MLLVLYKNQISLDRRWSNAGSTSQRRWWPSAYEDGSIDVCRLGLHSPTEDNNSASLARQELSCHGEKHQITEIVSFGENVIR